MNHMDDHALPELKPFACDICQKSYAKRFKLVQHKKLRHLKEEDKKFICKECGKAYVIGWYKLKTILLHTMLVI